MEEITWKEWAPRGKVLEELTTQCWDRLYGKIRKVRRETRDWDTLGGCLVTTHEDFEYLFDIYGQEHGGIKCGVKSTMEDAKKVVADAINLELSLQRKKV